MEIRLAKTQRDFFSLMKVRALVFMKEQDVDPLLEIDDEDQTCDHYVVEDEGNIIATLRILKHGAIWHIGRVAVLKEQRHKHCGSLMLKHVEEIAKQNNIKTLALGAQVSAIPFYEKNGYQIVGELYYDANIEHRNMEKQL